MYLLNNAQYKLDSIVTTYVLHLKNIGYISLKGLILYLRGHLIQIFQNTVKNMFLRKIS